MCPGSHPELIQEGYGQKPGVLAPSAFPGLSEFLSCWSHKNWDPGHCSQLSALGQNHHGWRGIPDFQISFQIPALHKQPREEDILNKIPFPSLPYLRFISERHLNENFTDVSFPGLVLVPLLSSSCWLWLKPQWGRRCESGVGDLCLGHRSSGWHPLQTQCDHWGREQGPEKGREARRD